MIDVTTRKINATAFHRALAAVIKDCSDELARAAPEAKMRKRFDAKMQAVINNCKLQ